MRIEREFKVNTLDGCLEAVASFVQPTSESFMQFLTTIYVKGFIGETRYVRLDGSGNICLANKRAEVTEPGVSYQLIDLCAAPDAEKKVEPVPHKLERTYIINSKEGAEDVLYTASYEGWFFGEGPMMDLIEEGKSVYINIFDSKIVHCTDAPLEAVSKTGDYYSTDLRKAAVVENSAPARHREVLASYAVNDLEGLYHAVCLIYERRCTLPTCSSTLDLASIVADLKPGEALFIHLFTDGISGRGTGHLPTAYRAEGYQEFELRKPEVNDVEGADTFLLTKEADDILDLKNFIETMLGGSFEGWSPEAVTGYRTACITLRERLKNILISKPVEPSKEEGFKVLGSLWPTEEEKDFKVGWKEPRASIDLRPNILETAAGLIYGPRAESYGKAIDNFNRIAAGWSQIVGVDMTAEQVGLMMTWLKISRQLHKPNRDNLVDAAGYLGCVEQVERSRAEASDVDTAEEELLQLPLTEEALESLADGVGLWGVEYEGFGLRWDVVGSIKRRSDTKAFWFLTVDAQRRWRSKCVADAKRKEQSVDGPTDTPVPLTGLQLAACSSNTPVYGVRCSNFSMTKGFAGAVTERLRDEPSTDWFLTIKEATRYQRIQLVFNKSPWKEVKARKALSVSDIRGLDKGAMLCGVGVTTASLTRRKAFEVLSVGNLLFDFKWFRNEADQDEYQKALLGQ